MDAEPERPQAIASEIDALEFVVEEGRIASLEDYGILRSWLCRLRPAWESTPSEPSTPGEGTSQRECAEPVAWLAHSDECQMVSLFREHAEAGATENEAAVVPLYRSPTLTDAERRAITRAVAVADEFHDTRLAATLRGLLERTQKVTQ